ncbi:hypothetical protein [Phyllobacterium sp. YR531]|uniref:hypothetical protein n=1 Tax=Phyllobacterium sp. YR531 TaxID=1144343 RepID=UPI0005951E73|nr:hypothetical protein [Phyllobacterium sp. YR531]
MTAPNNPTPDPITDADIDMLLRLLTDKLPPWSESPSTFYALIERVRQQTATIASLTAERDAAREELSKRIEYPIISRVELVRQIKAAASNSHADIGKQLQSYFSSLLSEAYRSNKLLSERIAVLEGENGKLRSIISESASACGAYVSPECSIEFMSELPKEIALVTRRARSLEDK